MVISIAKMRRVAEGAKPDAYAGFQLESQIVFTDSGTWVDP